MAPGTYRALLVEGARRLKVSLPGGLRLASAAYPIVGMTERLDLVEDVVRCLQESGADELVIDHYVRQLRGGVCVPVAPKEDGANKYWAPGELFLRS